MTASAVARRGAVSGPGAAGLAIVLWSLNATAAGVALERLSVWRVLFCEFGAAVVVVAISRSGRGRRGVDPVAAGLGALGLGATIVLQYVAFASAPLVVANAIAYAWPLLVALWLAARTRRRGRGRTLALALAGFAGVVLLLAGSGGTTAGPSASLLGYLAAGGSAVAMAAYTLGAAGRGERIADMLLAGALSGTAVTAVPASTAAGGWGPPWAVALSASIGVGMMAAGYGLWSLAMASPAGARLAPAAYAIPLLSTLLLLATGHRLGPLGLVGCALIVVCAGGVVRRPAAGGKGSGPIGSTTVGSDPDGSDTVAKVRSRRRRRSAAASRASRTTG